MNEKEKGNECFRVGDYEEAVVYYSRSLDAVDTTAVHNNRALTHLKAKHYIKAMVDLSIVLEAEPTNVKALLRQANALKGANRHTEALASANRVLELKPENKEATALKKELAKLAPAKKTPAKRMVIEEDSSSDEDEEGDAVTVHVDERESMKKAATPTPTPAPTPASTSKRIMIEEDSEDDSEDGSEDDEDVAPTTTAAAATTPAKAEPEPAATTGSGAEATTSFSDPAATPATEAVTAIKAPTPTPTSTPAPIIEDDETPADVLKLKDGGKDMFIQGNYAEAADKYSAALSALRSSGARCTKIQVALLSNRATCQLKIGQCSKCITDCDAVLHLDTSHAKAMLTRASANETKESFRKAFLDYKAVIEAYPSNKTASMGLARVTRMIEDLEGNAWVREQRGKTSVALTRAPGSSPMASPLQPRKTEGATTAAVKKPAASAAAVKRAAAPVAEDDGSSAAAQLAQAYDDLKAKGNTCVKEKRYDQAVNCYTQCVNLDATKAAALNNRALCYLKLSQWNQSITDCESVLTLEPNNSKAMYRKAQGFVGLGHTEDARAAYRSALPTTPRTLRPPRNSPPSPRRKARRSKSLRTSQHPRPRS